MLLKEGIFEYESRLKHYNPFVFREMPDIRKGSKLDKEKLKSEEGTLLLSKIDPADHVVLLDEKGKMFRSIEYADYLQKMMNAGWKNVCFLIGGAYGFSDEVYKRANDKISLSKMTFSHQMVRLFFLEQTYRAFTILKGEKYHHE